MKVLASLLLLGVVLCGCSGMVKRSASTSLFQSGKEYTYLYKASVTAGSADYVSFVSNFNLTGKVHVAAKGSNLNVQLQDLKFGVYNGEFAMDRKPEIVLQAYQQLNPLQEPFQVSLDNGKVKGVVLSGDAPEWAKNIQRGVANALQLSLADVDVSTAASLNVQESTIVGDCETDYEVIPKEDNKAGAHVAQVRKFRSHNKCQNAPVQNRIPQTSYHYCPDDNSRDVYNSSGFGVYDLELTGGDLVAKRILAASSVSYHIFSAKGHQQYTFANTEFILENVKDGGAVNAPANPKTYDNIKYVFEQTLEDDEDLTQPQPFYFHQKAGSLDAAAQTKAAEALENAINQLIESVRTTGVYKDLKEFHRVSPFSIIPHVNALDYEHLKAAYEKVKNDADVLKKKVFLDSLVITGTGPAALLIRDVIKESDNFFTTGRLLASLVSYVRNPTEKLVKEFEVLLKPTTTTRGEKLYGRVIDFAFASLIQRACKKNGCKQSGLLDKYVKYYSDRYDAADHFEEQTAAVAALNNIGIGGASEKLLAIVQNKQVDRTVRVAALPGLKYLAAKNPKVLKQALLAIFFDRSTHCELRAAAAKYAVVYAFTPEIVNQIVIYMWTEKSPLVKNYVYTLLKGVAATTRSCIQQKASYARTALSFFPPWTANPKYSANYLSDYYDKDYNFGQMTDYVVHKVGTTFLPTVAYINLNGAIAGYGNSYLTAFIRLEGLGKTVLDRLMTMKTQITKFDDIKGLYEKIGVVERKGTPLKLEVGLMLRGRIVTYHAADQTTLKEIPKIIRFITERAQKSYDTDLLHTYMVGGAMHERPNEFGTPVTARSAVTGMLSVHAKVDRSKTGDMLNQVSDLRFQGHLFGISGLDNHMPAFGKVFSVTAFRTTRVRLPRHVSLGVDLKQIQQQQYSLNIATDVPKEEDPAIAMFHASAVTTITPDATIRYKDSKVNLLQNSCPACKPLAVISKGDKYRDTRQIGFLYKYLTGVQGGLKYFDCEKVHNRLYVVKQLRKVFGPDNKNDGGRILSKIRLGLSYLRESLFLSPITQTCGLKAYYYQDKTQKTIFEKVEGQIRVKYTPEPDNKIGTKVTAKSSLKMIYGGAEPKTRNFDINANFQLTGLYKRDLRVRLGVKDEITNKNGVVCVDVSTVMSKPNDWFAYDGQNEPTQERTINIVYGPQTKDGKDTSCPDKATSPNIKYVRKSHRSQHQIEEAASDMWPYKQCREQRQSGKYPGTLYPATEACAWAAFEQTKLRESNITIDYKVDPEARNRWKRPGAVIATLLMPYWVPEDTVIDNHAEHHGHSEGNLISGRIAVDLDLSSDNPEADIHFHGSQGQHEHFHGIDLDALPVRLLNPVSTRFQPLQVAALKLGLYAYCDVTTGAVQTFDNLTYYADMSECPTLISGDCGATPRYAVYGRKIAADKIAVTIQLGGHKIELDNLNKAIVDGQEVTLTDTLYSANEKKIFQLFKVDENNVFLWSKTLGVYVRYTGHYTTVTAGSRYRGTNCGVCGNFNDIKSDDFTGPDGHCANMGANDMMKAYIVRDGSCQGVGSTCPVSA